MTESFSLTVRAGHPDFLDLDWSTSIKGWDHPRLLDLPKGISRHVVRFVGYDEGTYAIKELPLKAAHIERDVLRSLEEDGGPAVLPVGIVERPGVDPTAESAGAIITRYLDYSFSYRELLSGPGFGPRRKQMIDAVAGLLVELHLLGCFWGDCSLSNVLYRFDAEAIEMTMVDAETAELHPDGLTDGQREHDLAIMIENVAGGMADIAALAGKDMEQADVGLGEDIAASYRGLWAELAAHEIVAPHERYRITDRIRRLNDLGFEVDDIELHAVDGGHRVRFSFRVHGRNYHTSRLRELTGLDVARNQARHILADVNYHEAISGISSEADKAVAAVRWRVGTFEPLLQRISALPPVALDPIQGYCDFLNHRYQMSVERNTDVGDETAFADWVARGQPGYPLD